MKKKISILGLALFAAVCVFLWLYWKHMYPYGPKPARLPVVVSALRGYADDHGGTFPNVNQQPFASLALLYPKYLPDPVDLAGITGDERAVVERVSNGQALNGDICSWVYFPGFNGNTDARIAIIWEKASGVGFNGGRASGHAVGFIDGSHTQIPEQQWDTFLTEQARLRTAAVK